MSDEQLIQTIRTEIRDAFRQDREKTVKETLERFGLDMSANDDEISQNKADKIIGRAARTEGMINKTIRYRNVKNGRWGRVMVCRADVMKLRNMKKF